jgi:hypothetical protein
MAMQTLKSTLTRISAAAIFTLAGGTAAYALGSIPLTEVMDQLKGDTKLIAEIDNELKTQGLLATDVICSGLRFGNHWENLGGARAIPFDCDIGKLSLRIDGELHLYDKDGKELDADAEGTPAAATDYKATDLKWEWK